MSVARRQRTVKIGLFLTNRMNTFCAFFFFNTNTRAIGAENRDFATCWLSVGCIFFAFFTFFKSYAPCVGADPRVCPFEWIADSGQTDRFATLLPEGRADTGGCPYSWLQVIKHPIYGHKTLHYGRPLSRGSKSPL